MENSNTENAPIVVDTDTHAAVEIVTPIIEDVKIVEVPDLGDVTGPVPPAVPPASPTDGPVAAGPTDA